MSVLRSLRFRVTVLATVAALLILTGAAYSMLAFQERQLLNAVDASLDETIDEVEGWLPDIRFDRAERPSPDVITIDDARKGAQPEPRGGEIDTATPLIDLVTDSALTLQLLGPDGSVMAASGDLRRTPALLSAKDISNAQRQLRNRDGFATVGTRNHGRFRISATAVGTRMLIAGYSMRDVDRSLGAQRTTLMGAVPSLAALMGLLNWLVLGQALRPVEAIRREVRAIGPDELGRRVPEPANAVELERLASTMNEMLERLDDSAERQHRFIADAAHELRSPLAGMRGQLEVNLAHPDAPERREAEESILVETKRMQRLVDDLLLLTRADHNSLALGEHVVDLDDLVLEEAGRLRQVSSLTINTERVSAGQIIGDEAQLRRVIRNLADNAIRHAETTVSFALDEGDGRVELVVSDDGTGVPAADAERIFERFTRRDDARDRDSGGSGLGLAISREIAHKHGGTLVLDSTSGPQTGARFVLRLPIAAGN